MTKNQKAVYVFSVAFFIIAVVFGLRDEQALGITALALILACLLAIVAAVNPDSIVNLGFMHDKGGTQFGVTRHVPAPQEIAQVLALADDDPSSSLPDDPLVTAARERNPGQKAATDFLLLATDAWKEGRIDEGLAYAFQGLALEPGDSRVKASLENRIGTLFKELDSANNAMEFYDRAIQTDSSFSWPHVNLGILLKEDGRTTEAKAAYRRAIALDPEETAAHNNLALLLEKEGRTAEAEAAYRRALALDPEHSMAHLNLGTLLEKEGRTEEAAEHFAKGKAN